MSESATAVPHLEAQRLNVERSGKLLLKDVSVSLRRGCVTAIVGPSGAGKTTLLRCLNGLQAPTSGTVLFDGIDVLTLDAVDLRRRVGLVFQLPMLFEGDVRDNLAYGAEGLTEERAHLALERAGLDDSFAPRLTSTLSVGESQRVAIARALVRDPEVLLMDEPTSALDRDARATIEGLIKSLGGEGLTTVLVTHDLGQAERVAQDAWVIVDGQVKANGEPGTLEQMWADHR